MSKVKAEPSDDARKLFSIKTKALRRATARHIVEYYAAAAKVPTTEFLKGKVAVVTGGNSGIGLETCKCLASAGCRVIMSSRNVDAGQMILKNEIAGSKVVVTGNYDVPNALNLVKVVALDLERLDSIRSFAEAVRQEPRIDFLVLNAGGPPPMTLQRLPHGFEKSIGACYFGHFYLYTLLRDKLLTQPSPCRVVSMSGDAHKFGRLDLLDLHFERGRKYHWMAAIAQVSNAKVMFARELARQTDRIGAVSLHPGVINTNIGRTLPWYARLLLWLLSPFFNGLPRGAATVAFACLDPDLDSPALRGSYLDGCAVAPFSHQANDPALCSELWEATETQLRAALAAEAAAVRG